MKKSKKPFKIIADAPAMLARLHELTGNELKVWMYFWLRTASEGTAFPGNKTIAQELEIDIDTVKHAKRELRAKGWTNRERQRRRDDGTLSTVVEKVHLPWTEKASTVSPTVEGKSTDGTVVEKTHQQKEYVVLPPEVSPLAHSDKADEVNNNNDVVVVPQTPETQNEDGLVAGYTAEEIAEHAEKCKLNPWVHVNDSPAARKRPGFVRHLMTIDPPKRPLKMVDGKPLPSYRQESGERDIFGKGDI